MLIHMMRNHVDQLIGKLVCWKKQEKWSVNSKLIFCVIIVFSIEVWTFHLLNLFLYLFDNKKNTVSGQFA